MKISIGDKVVIEIIEVMQYACWGKIDEYICFVHCTEWSNERPVPDNAVPKIGEFLKVKVFYVADWSKEIPPADVTCDGKYHVNLAGSVSLLNSQK